MPRLGFTYSPECVEKLFGKSVWGQDRAQKATKRVPRSLDRPALTAEDAQLRSLKLLSERFRSPIFSAVWGMKKSEDHRTTGTLSAGENNR